MQTTTIIAVVSDTQAGSYTAVAPLEYEVHTSGKAEEKQTKQANKLQADLFEKWREWWGYVYTLAGIKGKTRKHRLVVVHLGDVIEGNHHGSTQLETEIPDQLIMAERLMDEPHNKSDIRVGIIGTEAHAGPNGASEWEFYRANNYQYIGEQLSIEVDGKLFDLAHHGRASARPWGSMAAGVATETALSYAQAGLRPPDYVLRGHVHRIDDSGVRVIGTRAFMCPSWQFRTMFGYRVSTAKMTDIGGLIFNAGEMDLSRVRYRFPSSKEVISI